MSCLHNLCPTVDLEHDRPENRQSSPASAASRAEAQESRFLWPPSFGRPPPAGGLSPAKLLLDWNDYVAAFARSRRRQCAALPHPFSEMKYLTPRGETPPQTEKKQRETEPRRGSGGCQATVLHADEASVWNDLHARYVVKRIDHQQAYSLDGACTNWAESYFSRLRRGEAGHHHHISGPHLLRFARKPHGARITAGYLMGSRYNELQSWPSVAKKSVDFTGYWQRHAKT